MRRRLVLVAVAVTSMVALAFVVPLGILVRDLARDRALVDGERQAQDVARLIAILLPARGVDGAVEATAAALGAESRVAIVLPDGSIVGAAELQPGESLEGTSSSAFRSRLVGGEAVYVPVVRADGEPVIVRVFVPDDAITDGVMEAWLILALLAVTLVIIAVFVADRLGWTVVRPVNELTSSATRLGQGDLSAKVEPSGPDEVRRLGEEFNRLAGEIDRLVQEERELSADISHRLRTPLTAVRLDAEAVPPGPETARLLDDLDELERMTDYVIRETRRPARETTGATADLVAIARERTDFWQPLAEEQSRKLRLDVDPAAAHIATTSEDATAMIDALIGNIFSHTEPGTDGLVSVRTNDSDVVLSVEDGGPGVDDADLMARGRSGGSSTGLGLDIARRTALGAGGVLEIRPSALGGTAFVVTVPRVSGSTGDEGRAYRTESGHG